MRRSWFARSHALIVVTNLAIDHLFFAKCNLVGASRILTSNVHGVGAWAAKSAVG